MRSIPFPAVAGAAYALVAAQAYRPLISDSGPTFCPFRLATGLPCPGCGMGHALVYALRGDFAASFHSHPLGIPLLAIWTGWLLWGAVNLARGRGFSDGFLPPIRRPAASWAMLLIVLAVYAVRLV